MLSARLFGSPGVDGGGFYQVDPKFRRNAKFALEGSVRTALLSVIRGH